jgi:hypothetical protein
MDFSKLPAGIVTQLAGAAEAFIVSSRKKYASQGVPMTAAQRKAMQPFFAAEILDQTRLVTLRGSRVEDPPFFAMAKMMGIRNLLSFSDIAAVTFVDIIVSHEEFSHRLLFHELVHAAQYAVMGTGGFASRYVKGFLQGGSYEEIPLERNAYELEKRFSRNKEAFSVADEIRSWMEQGKL